MIIKKFGKIKVPKPSKPIEAKCSHCGTLVLLETGDIINDVNLGEYWDCPMCQQRVKYKEHISVKKGALYILVLPLAPFTILLTFGRAILEAIREDCRKNGAGFVIPQYIVTVGLFALLIGLIITGFMREL
jgi:DNA-directed RNA polymerase subunit RPC12/RpoP